MLRIIPYEKDSFSFYEEVVNSKRNTKNKPRLKKELEMISNTQSSYFNVYDKAFYSNSLAIIEAVSYDDNNKANLNTLYSYRNKKIQDLKNLLTRHPLHTEHILNTCQNCTINEADTMDHILGQTEFPEFAVHPKNLFPCCSVCNKKKSDKYVNDEGSQLFLNLFLDNLPQSQYLHVEFGDNWLPRFRLEQPEDVSDNTFHLIERHYEQLGLLTRFSDSSNEIISSLRSTIKVFGGTEIGGKIEELCLELEPVLGYNHRKVVLTRALGLSKEFIIDCIG
ncbi:hypothetical protein [Shewanella surugensis]|uniref:HNH endonuclease n=1 Tax=Shewanella surugensis TaxID=212020 RepID=A0ABT0LDE3_9GAMM|nr:hypothetical protein [Shewanella surugensis]MCL1125589.1 hypothetical protein [Shewanella surugensis]